MVAAPLATPSPTTAGGSPHAIGVVPAVLAVDGGNSKTHVALVAGDGSLLGAARTGPGSYHAVGMRRMLATIEEGRRLAALDAGLDPVETHAAVGVYCLAGADLPLDDQRLRASLRRAGFADRTQVRNDAFAGLRAGCAAGWGVSIVLGTGMNCAGVGPTGRTVRFASLGALSGDEGGGGDLVVKAVAAAIRARDGRGPRTLLEERLTSAAGVRRPQDLLTAVRRNTLSELDMVAMAPLVFAAATDGDAVARSLVSWLADEAALLGISAIRRLGLVRSEVEVVLSGSIWRTDDAAFHARVRERLLAVAPRALIRRLDAPPVLGSALLGLDLLGAGADAEARARATITAARVDRPAG